MTDNNQAAIASAESIEKLKKKLSRIHDLLAVKVQTEKIIDSLLNQAKEK